MQLKCLTLLNIQGAYGGGAYDSNLERAVRVCK